MPFLCCFQTLYVVAVVYVCSGELVVSVAPKIVKVLNLICASVIGKTVDPNFFSFRKKLVVNGGTNF